MALFSSNNRPDGYVGLDITGSFVAATQVADGAVKRAVSQDLEPGVVKDGEVADSDRLADFLRNLFRRTSLPKKVRIGVANPQIVVRDIEMPSIADEQERDAAVRFQIPDAVAMPLDEAVVDYQVIGERESEGMPKSDVLVVAARRSMVMRVRERARRRRAATRGRGSQCLCAASHDRERTGARRRDPRVLPSRNASSTSRWATAGSACSPALWRAAPTVRREWSPSRRSCGSPSSTTGRGALPGPWTSLCSPARARRRKGSPRPSKTGSSSPPRSPSRSAPSGPKGCRRGDDPYRYTVSAGLAMGAA